MPAQFKTLRSTVAGNRPQPATRQVGEVYINYPDMQFGVIDVNQNPLDLFAVRFFSGATSYNGGDFVVSGGQLYRANGAIPPGAFNPANWSKVGTSQDLVGYLPLTGGALSGPLTLAADPSTNLGASTKQYSDTKVPLAGGTMTGPLILSADPTANLGAATKQYSDAKVAKAGDTMAGPLTLAADPSTNLGAATKQYADTKVAKAGDTMTGPLILSGAPTAPLQAATKAYVDSGAFVPITGGTMTGPLTLSGAPAGTLDAATKAYADTKLPLAGGTVTGPLTVSSTLTVNGGATTVQALTSGAHTVNGQLNASGQSILGASHYFGYPTVTDFVAYYGSPYKYLQYTNGWYWRWNTSGGQLDWVGNNSVYASFNANGISYASGNFFRFSWTSPYVYVYVDGTNVGDIVYSYGAANQWPAYIIAANTNGNVYLWHAGGQYSWANGASDIRLKTNLASAEKDALAAINTLKVLEFDMRPSPEADSQHWNWGIVADEALNEAIPSAYVAPLDTESYAHLRDLPIVAALVRAVQQLSAKVETLEARLAA